MNCYGFTSIKYIKQTANKQQIVWENYPVQSNSIFFSLNDQTVFYSFIFACIHKHILHYMAGKFIGHSIGASQWLLATKTWIIFLIFFFAIDQQQYLTFYNRKLYKSANCDFGKQYFNDTWQIYSKLFFSFHQQKKS